MESKGTKKKSTFSVFSIEKKITFGLVYLANTFKVQN